VDYERLMAVHAAITGTGAGRRYGVEVLNKSAVLVVYACWEAYIEDVLSELIARLLRQAESPNALPDALKLYIKKQLDSTKHDYAIWGLAGKKWRSQLTAFLSGMADLRNFHFNSATADQVDKLFSDSVGTTLSNAWHWKGMSVVQARDKVRALVRLRGALAHRSVAKASVTKVTVDDYARFVKALVGKTDKHIVHAFNYNGFGPSTPIDLVQLVPPPPK
jgi:hypothetical protein